MSDDEKPDVEEAAVDDEAKEGQDDHPGRPYPEPASEPPPGSSGGG